LRTHRAPRRRSSAQDSVHELAMKRRLQPDGRRRRGARVATIASRRQAGHRKDDPLLAASRSPLRPPRIARLARLARLARAIGCAALLAALGAGLSGCGSSKPSGTTADPASAVPASAALYASATVRPSASEQTAALAAGQALTHQADPYLRLLAALQTPGSPQLNYKSDVAPWLGPHAGVFLTSLGSSSSALLTLLEQGLLGGATTAAFPFGAGGAEGAIVLDTSDVAKATSFLAGQAAHASAHAASYRGVSYQLSAGGVAFGVVDRFAVIGSESGMRSVIDTTLGASALVHASGYAKLLAVAPSDAVAHIYSNPASGEASPATQSAQAGSTEGLSGLLSLLAGTREANVSLVLSGAAGSSADSLALDADTLTAGSTGAAGGLLASDPQGAQALAELPGESWLAIGLGHVGTTLAEDVQGLRSFTTLATTFGGSAPESASALSLGSLLTALTTPLSVLGADNAQAKRDFASWMGSAGIFASGSSLLELKGAVTIASTNPEHSRAAVGELAAQLRAKGVSVTPVSIAGTDAAISVRLNGLPVVIDIANGTDSSGQTKFVLAIGEASVAAALSPPSTLSGSAPLNAATAALGEGIQPTLIVDFPTLLSLFEGLGLTEDPAISKLIPYLRSATSLAGGGHPLSSEVERFRLVVGLQPSTQASSG
jgi:Protein of unknown function (DUF3352)